MGVTAAPGETLTTLHDMTTSTGWVVQPAGPVWAASGGAPVLDANGVRAGSGQVIKWEHGVARVADGRVAFKVTYLSSTGYSLAFSLRYNGWSQEHALRYHCTSAAPYGQWAVVAENASGAGTSIQNDDLGAAAALTAQSQWIEFTLKGTKATVRYYSDAAWLADGAPFFVDEFVLTGTAAEQAASGVPGRIAFYSNSVGWRFDEFRVYSTSNAEDIPVPSYPDGVYTLGTLMSEVRERGYHSIVDPRLKRIANDAVRELARKSIAWPWLEQTVTGTAPLLLPRLRAVADVRGADRRRLRHTSLPQLEHGGDPLYVSGRGSEFYVDAGGRARTFPDSTEQLTVRYFAWPLVMENPEQGIPVPEELHALVLDLAVIGAAKEMHDWDTVSGLRVLVNEAIGEALDSYIDQQIADHDYVVHVGEWA